MEIKWVLGVQERLLEVHGNTSTATTWTITQ